jgi:UDP-N-acetylglucosamine diphosphorylase / glucose-1-phosphate thymidylyltransferase / UDP-N-acetylgalactosamine diphosphorylase / glucosamine-1-phosphate N-acetyltransferase / galactosamine-1-phosphate N-acetyltransferase
MQTPLILYEDSGWQRLLPLVYIRPVFQLMCGMEDLLSKVRRLAGDFAIVDGQNGHSAAQRRPIGLWCRPAIAEVVAEHTGLPVNRDDVEPVLLLNGRGLWHRLPECEPGETPWVGTVGPHQRIACLYADAALMRELSPTVLLDDAQTGAALAGLPRRDVSDAVTVFDWPWEIVNANERTLITDWRQLADGAGENWGTVAQGSYLLAADSIHIGRFTRIKPCVVIDAEQGPVWIGDNVTILPHSYVQGPAYIGDDCLLQPGSVVHAGTTVGRRSKVGGEIEASIIQGFSNKQHDGFLGHSYVGSWVNIAADCINSDLKNTYGNVRVPINGREVDTGEMFVGMLVGDYSKTGINVSFPTGAVIGFCSSVFASRSPKFVPSFAWLDGDSEERFDERRGLAVARKMMARRNRTMTAAEEAVFLAVRRQALAIEHQPQMRLEFSHDR